MIKKILPDIIAIVALIFISYAYFTPAVFQDRVLLADDNTGGWGSNSDIGPYREQTGEHSRWTNSIFSGMPNYQLDPNYDSQTAIKKFSDIYHLYLPTYVWYLFVMLIGFYILMRVMKMLPLMSVLGAIIWALSSYFIIIIGAGHIWKLTTLAYVPPTIAGIILAYRGKYLPGALLAAVFAALQIQANHLQMTYYFLFVIFFMAVAYFVSACKEKQLPRFFKATGALVVAAILAVSVNLSSIYHTYEYSKESIRGKSELVKENSADQTNSGLDRSYITAWSYGIDETLTLLVPDVKGGSSNIALSDHKSAIKSAPAKYRQTFDSFGSYWGEQPGTSGPVYVGAFVLFLFIFGLFVVKGPLKWALFASTILSILLSWGHNFMWFTNLFIDYMPMYSKFRTVSSILVVAEFTIPLLAILALKEIVTKEETLKNKKALLWSTVLTAGVALILALFPGLSGRFISSGEINALEGIEAQVLNPVLDAITQVRMTIVSQDALRSLIIIIVGIGLLLLLKAKKLKATPVVAMITVLCLVDMWLVDKRYLGDKDFQRRSAQKEINKITAADEEIRRDESLNYRVLKLSGDAFTENGTAQWHKSIGGYHAAKLRRYQELIDEHIFSEMEECFTAVSVGKGDMSVLSPMATPVLNMLNTKYFLVPLTNGEVIDLPNPNAFGNAWFVNEVAFVDNANQEIEALHQIDPRFTAVVDKRFSNAVSEPQSVGTISLESYAPNKLVYKSSNAGAGTAVFSEIYYPSWRAYIDGEQVEIARANYVLRALNVPAGNHTIAFVFDPISLHRTETIANIANIILLLGLILSGAIGVKRLQKMKKTMK